MTNVYQRKLEVKRDSLSVFLTTYVLTDKTDDRLSRTTAWELPECVPTCF